VTARQPGAPPEALRSPACALGADAVLVTQDPPPDQFGRAHLAGTAIRFDPAPPADGPPPGPADVSSTSLWPAVECAAACSLARPRVVAVC
jgi:hypothetical protein